jgi:hypothetical protein
MKKYTIVEVINLETNELCEVAIHKNRIGREVEPMFDIVEGDCALFINPDFSTFKTTTVQEIIVNNEDALIFTTKNSEYVLEVVGLDEN